MSIYYAHLAVPIVQPDHTYFAGWERVSSEPFMFDKRDRFTLYRRKGEPVFQLAKDDRNHWYFMTMFTSKNLSGLKWARQSSRPAYVDEGAELPLADLLEQEGLEKLDYGFDKAFAHTSAFVDSLDEFPAEWQARLANADGEDDPTVVDNIHFLKNSYNGKRTRYITGAETRSFATVTENERYFNEIHLETNAFLYLLYFLYFTKQQILPSKQMVPKLLGNLWASKQAMNANWNPSLLQSERLETMD
ncbi:hypothetical protein D1B31_22655 [Neobacillus notoginsengisoli]|uniref:Uncharacterized protein n=1 Tax=Neobacillus notoginsengisoli TaxID=1578198 RepID=A0A417YES4_9BACI|nr:hypothetical protein [Neobacillus notoginsengisoli]RHW31188.1 hypothetical protein D1B31_22655 [Neobacillus notoginsengisoli]